MDQIDARVVALQVIEAGKNSENAYDCLLLPRTASFLEAKAAYKRMLFLHPDKNPTLDIAHEAFKIVRAAFDEIKLAQTLPDLPGGIANSSASVVNKWSAYTSTVAGDQANHIDIPRGGTPHPTAQPPMVPPPQQQPTAWNPLPAQPSKWGRPSTDVQRLLKVPEASTSLPQNLGSEDLHNNNRHRAQSLTTSLDNDLEKHSPDDKPKDNEDVIEIGCGSFYGSGSRPAAHNTKQQKQQQESLPFSTAAAAAPPQQNGRKDISKWKDTSKHNPLAELLRNPEAATAVAPTRQTKDEKAKQKKRPASKGKASPNQAQKKRQVSKHVVIDSDSDDECFIHPQKRKEKNSKSDGEDDGANGGGGGDGGTSSSSSDGWDSQDESEKEEIVSEAAGEAKSKALIQLLLAQQRSQARHRLQAGAAGVAQQTRGRAASRGRRKRRQTRLKLAPVTSSK